MVEFAAISTPLWVSSPTKSKSKSRAPKTSFTGRFSQNPVVPPFQAFPFLFAAPPNSRPKTLQSSHELLIKSCGSFSFSWRYRLRRGTCNRCEIPNIVDPTGLLECIIIAWNWEKVFAIIGVKIYAAGLYMDLSILKKLDAGKGKSAAEIQGDASLFDLIFQATLEKSLHIVLVRDVDGKTFWGALDDAISPRIKSPTPDYESALSTFRGIFQGRSLKKGTFIFLTSLNPTKMLVSVSAGTPSGVDATIESKNVTLALFDVFFGGEPVSPSLKASVANGLATALK